MLKLCTTKYNGHTLLVSLWGNADSAHPGQGLDPLNYGWKEKNGYNTPDWFLGPSLPYYIFHEGEREEDSLEDHQSDQPDVATVFENNDDSIPKMLGEMTGRVKQRSNRL